MKGYYKNEEATKAVLDEDGWLHTGDMGTISADGTIFIKGRSKTMILTSNGQNIYPEEIEAKLNNMPFVMESLIVERDGKLVALVCPDYEAMDSYGVSNRDLPMAMEEVRNNLNKMLAPYEQITRIQLYPNEFEKTPKFAMSFASCGNKAAESTEATDSVAVVEEVAVEVVDTVAADSVAVDSAAVVAE